MKPCTLLAVYYRKCKTAAWIFCFANCCNLYTCLIFCYTCHICSLHRNSKMEVFFFGLLIYTRFCHHHSYFAIPDQVNSICSINFCVVLDNRLESTRIFQLWRVSTSREYSQTRRSSLSLCHTTSDLHLVFKSNLDPISDTSLKIGKIVETSLSANQERAAMEKKRLKWKVQGPPADEKVIRGGPVDPSKLVIELGPMEIRTFIVSFERSISGKQLL